MFSIEKIREKVNQSKSKSSFLKFICGDISTLLDVFLLVGATSVFSIPGLMLGVLVSKLFLMEYALLVLPLSAFLSTFIFWFTIYKGDEKDHKKKNYNVSQEDLKEYIKSLEEEIFKKYAIDSIAETAKENKGNITFKEFERIYNNVEKLKQTKQLEKENQATAEATECLVQFLREELIIEKEKEKIN